MAMVLSGYSAALALAVIVTLSLASIGFYRRRVRGAGAFVGLVASAAFYAFGSLFEIRSLSVEEVGFWLSIEYLGIAIIGPFWTMLAIDIAGRGGRGSKTFRLFGLAIPLLVIVAVFTNGSHHLFYTSIVLERHGPFSVPAMGKGPLYLLNFAYMNLCILAGTVIIIRFIVDSRGVYRRQGAVLVAGSIVPWLGMAIYQAGLSPYGLDIAPFGLTVSAVLYAWGLFKHQLLDLSPVAHRNVFMGLHDGVLVVDLKGRVLAANPAMVAIIPTIVPDQVGQKASVSLGGQPELLRLLAGGAGACLDLAVERDGRSLRFEAISSAMLDSRSRKLGTIITLRDVTARVELLDRMATMAVTDVLTGVPNRRHFIEVAEREVDRARRYGRPLAIAIMDLDNFKKVNDRHGHQAGDAVLVAAAKACTAALRTTDFFARYGGEEFALILSDSPPGESIVVLERIRAALAELVVSYDPGGGGAVVEIRITGSLGSSFRTRIGDENLDRLLREADEALYRAKEGGRNRVVISEAGLGQGSEADEAFP